MGVDRRDEEKCTNLRARARVLESESDQRRTSSCMRIQRNVSKACHGPERVCWRAEVSRAHPGGLSTLEGQRITVCGLQLC